MVTVLVASRLSQENPELHDRYHPRSPLELLHLDERIQNDPDALEAWVFTGRVVGEVMILKGQPPIGPALAYDRTQFITFRYDTKVPGPHEYKG